MPSVNDIFEATINMVLCIIQGRIKGIKKQTTLELDIIVGTITRIICIIFQLFFFLPINMTYGQVFANGFLWLVYQLFIKGSESDDIFTGKSKTRTREIYFKIMDIIQCGLGFWIISLEENIIISENHVDSIIFYTILIILGGSDLIEILKILCRENDEDYECPGQGNTFHLWNMLGATVGLIYLLSSYLKLRNDERYKNNKSFQNYPPCCMIAEFIILIPSIFYFFKKKQEQSFITTQANQITDDSKKMKLWYCRFLGFTFGWFGCFSSVFLLVLYALMGIIYICNYCCCCKFIKHFRVNKFEIYKYTIIEQREQPQNLYQLTNL